jgi:hypothetical protein
VGGFRVFFAVFLKAVFLLWVGPGWFRTESVELACLASSIPNQLVWYGTGSKACPFFRVKPAELTGSGLTCF